MLLALDIGNTAVKAGLFEGEALVRSVRVASPEALVAWLGPVAVRRAALASVVPAAAGRYAEALAERLGAPPLVVQAGLRLPFAMAYGTPQTLGADRIAAAAGAVARFPGADPLVVVDAGTAVTVEVVADGAYRGGAIAPGPDLLRRALTTGTAQLPVVPPDLPASPVGASTVEAIQAGVGYLFVDGVAGLLARTAAALGREPLVVATGGWAAHLAAHVPAIGPVEPDLVLYGVAALAAGNP